MAVNPTPPPPTGSSGNPTTSQTIQTTWREKLDNGVEVFIRPISKEDESRERQFIESLSPKTRSYRFFEGMKSPSPKLLKQLTDIDHQNSEALIALIDKDGEELEIGVARYALTSDDNTCECALVVGDEWQNSNLGVILMQHLIDIARQRGIQKLYAIEAWENTWIRNIDKALGFVCKSDPGDATRIICTLDL